MSVTLLAVRILMFLGVWIFAMVGMKSLAKRIGTDVAMKIAMTLSFGVPLTLSVFFAPWWVPVYGYVCVGLCVWGYMGFPIWKGRGLLVIPLWLPGIWLPL